MRLNSKLVVVIKTLAYNAETGGESSTTTSATHWGNVKQLDEKTALNFGMNLSNKNYSIFMRKTNISIDDTITYDGATLRVYSIKDYSQAGQFITILASGDRN